MQQGGLYKDTVDLPQTNFNMKANAVQREPEIQKLWEDKQILQKIVERNTGVCVIVSDQIFSLHAFEVVVNVEDDVVLKIFRTHPSLLASVLHKAGF